MRYDLLIKNGLVYIDGGFKRLDIAVANEKIVALLQPDHAESAEKELDATGKYVLPGMIDFHCHVREPGKQAEKETYETISKAAANGGMTMICTMPNGLLRSLADPESYQMAIDAGEANSVVDFHPAASPMGFEKGNVAELAKKTAFFKLHQANFPNVPMEESFGTMDSYVLDRCLAEVAKTGRYIGVHPTDGSYNAGTKKAVQESDIPMDLYHVLPYLYGDEEMSSAAWHLAYYMRKHKVKWLAMHCWHPGYIDLIRMLKKQGDMDIVATLEVCPSNGLTDYLTDPDTGFQIALGHTALPDWDKVWEAVNDGTIDILGTDHSPHLVKHYHPETPFASAMGVPGLDWYGHLMLNEVNNGKLTLERLVQLTSENGCKAFGWYDRKGSNLPGTDADFTICDMEREWTIGSEPFYTKCHLSPYYGMKLKGKVTQTIVRGTVVMDEGQILVEPGYGKFVTPM